MARGNVKVTGKKKVPVRKAHRASPKKKRNWRRREEIPNTHRILSSREYLKEGDLYWSAGRVGWVTTQDAGNKTPGWTTYIREVPARKRPASKASRKRGAK